MSTATHNVDPVEIEKFEQLASRWWDATGEFKPLHDINPLRLDWISDRAKLAGNTVLDVGCGGGILTESMVDAGATVLGIDLGDAPLAVAKMHAAETGKQIKYQKISVEALAEQQSEAFDVITCMELLEHVPSPQSTVAACAKLVKPGGHVFFSTINRNPKSWLFAIVGAEYLLKILPKGTHDYFKFIQPAELETWARQAGLTTQELTGMHYNPIFKQYSLGLGVDVNYIVHTIRTHV